MTEVTTLAKNSRKFATLRTTVPMSIVKQWELRKGDKLEWSWVALNGELVQVVRKVGYRDQQNSFFHDPLVAHIKGQQIEKEKEKGLSRPGDTVIRV